MNIQNYAAENLNTFDREPLQIADCLVLSWLSYLRLPEKVMSEVGFQGIRLCDLYKAEYFDEMLNRVYDSQKARELFFTLAASPRYRDCILKGYTSHFDPVEEKQFSAVTIQFQDDAHFVSFRGTDSTLVGWKEDFNMAFTCPVPAQKEAANYLYTVGKKTSGRLYAGGHSKGGNLAFYAAAECEELADRIVEVYSFDGPGFLEEVLLSDKFQKIKDKFVKIVPKSSVIGMLMETEGKLAVVESDAVGLSQHSVFTWQIENHDFIYLPDLKKNALAVDKTVNDWLKALTKEQRAEFFDTLFSLTENLDAVTVADISQNGKANYPQLVENLSKLDPDTRKFVIKTAGNLVKYPFQNFTDYLKLGKNSAE